MDYLFIEINDVDATRKCFFHILKNYPGTFDYQYTVTTSKIY